MFNLYSGDALIGASELPIAYDASQNGWIVGQTLIPDPGRVMVAKEVKTKLSRVQFKMQFTQAERLAISAARNPDPATATTDQKNLAAALNDFFDILNDVGLNYVDLTAQMVIDGVNTLAAVGIVAAGRPAQILAGVEVAI